MLRDLHFLQFSIGYLIGFNEKFCSQCKMIGLVLDLQAFQLKHGIDGHENMIVLRDYRAGWRFHQSGIGFQRFMKLSNFLPFLVDRCDIFDIARHITAHQIQQTGAAVFVCKDSPH